MTEENLEKEFPPIKRKLTGMYFRVKDPTTGKFEAIDFLDLSEEEQKKQLEGRTPEWLISMIMSLSKSYRGVADQFDISAGE